MSFWKGPLTPAHVPTGFFEMKMKYDESDNALIRASRALTDKVTDLLGEWLACPCHQGWQQGRAVGPRPTPGSAASRGPILQDGDVRGAHGDPAS